MKEYDLNEMQQMQEKALERVRNMQARASEVVKEENEREERTKSQSSSADNSPRERFYNTVRQTPKQNHIRMPVEMPENVRPYEPFSEYFEKENEKIAEQKAQTEKARLVDGVLNEPDKALLFALLLLMQSDNADEELMMSLLYIML